MALPAAIRQRTFSVARVLMDASISLFVLRFTTILLAAAPLRYVKT
jgi:hypothetical protein